MSAAMHSFYLRNMYLENKLVEPGGVTLDGVPIDLRKIKTPTYIISTQEDHIAPWKSTYAATGLYKGPMKFVLSGSGHIAGVVNPPATKKYCHWIVPANKKNPKNPDDWFEAAKNTKARGGRTRPNESRATLARKTLPHANLRRVN
jgi:polyhydroxyalkanoate synthase